METDTVILNRQALLLFNFMSMKQRNNRRIGDLSIGDFVEMCIFLEEAKNATN
jgi:hypothetical protein